MDTNEIRGVLVNDFFTKKVFQDVLPVDKLPIKVTYPSAFVVNTDPSYMPGEHWLALYFNEKGHCDFFDSFGNHPNYFGFVEYLNTVSKGWAYNKVQLQHNINKTCGNYCIFFLLLRSRNFSMNEIVKNFFSKNDLLLNDFLISNII